MYLLAREMSYVFIANPRKSIYSFSRKTGERLMSQLKTIFETRFYCECYKMSVFPWKKRNDLFTLIFQIRAYSRSKCKDLHWTKFYIVFSFFLPSQKKTVAQYLKLQNLGWSNTHVVSKELHWDQYYSLLYDQKLFLIKKYQK